MQADVPSLWRKALEVSHAYGRQACVCCRAHASWSAATGLLWSPCFWPPAHRFPQMKCSPQEATSPTQCFPFPRHRRACRGDAWRMQFSMAMGLTLAAPGLGRWHQRCPGSISHSGDSRITISPPTTPPFCPWFCPFLAYEDIQSHTKAQTNAVRGGSAHQDPVLAKQGHHVPWPWSLTFHNKDSGRNSTQKPTHVPQQCGTIFLSRILLQGRDTLCTVTRLCPWKCCKWSLVA